MVRAALNCKRFKHLSRGMNIFSINFHPGWVREVIHFLLDSLNNTDPETKSQFCVPYFLRINDPFTGLYHPLVIWESRWPHQVETPLSTPYPYQLRCRSFPSSKLTLVFFNPGIGVKYKRTVGSTKPTSVVPWLSQFTVSKRVVGIVWFQAFKGSLWDRNEEFSVCVSSLSHSSRTSFSTLTHRWKELWTFTELREKWI